MDSLRFPIGTFECPTIIENSDRLRWIASIQAFPQQVQQLVAGLDSTALSARYRTGGWTIQQVVHHCADSHMNCLIRLKLALTEEEPTITPYREDLWADCADYALPYNNSLTILHAVHRKIIALLRPLSHTQLERNYYHPQYKRHFAVRDVICLYAWHGNHHLAHITSLKERMGWS